MTWDWSKAGDASRPEDPHHYLKIKGEFVYGNNVTPEYDWFNLSVDRYLLGDKINQAGVTDINRPRGSRKRLDRPDLAFQSPQSEAALRQN